MTKINTDYQWNFQRVGGLDQVLLNNSDDLAHLDELDPKLWVALSCPSSGLEIENKILALLDNDKDGRIRIPDIVSAIKWLKTRLTSLDNLINGSDELPIDAINADTPEGQKILITIKAILNNISEPDKTVISLTDLASSNKVNNDKFYNGDGIIPVTSKIDADLQAFIKDAISVMGSVVDASGLNGINVDISNGFKSSLQNWLTWHESVGSATTPFDVDTAEVWQLVQDLKDKIEDYFLRTELASYAPNAEKSLNVDEKYIVPTDNGLLENNLLAELPLSKVEANRPLIISSGLNPIWRPKVQRLIELVKPFIANENELTKEDWHHINEMLSPYAVAVSSKPALAKVTVTAKPTMTIDKLGKNRINQLLGSDIFDKFAIIAEMDSKTPAAAADIADLERLITYHRHFYRLLMNFVSFKDFFDLDKNRAAFQAGRLFIDGRCCSLCILVSDVNKHVQLASYSELFLLYCECTRKNVPQGGSVEKKLVVAAMTAGDANFLLDGRNGVFIDNEGNDYDAKIIKIVSKPISISQAIWDPYKRFGRFITNQINKWASSKDEEIVNSATKTATATTDKSAFDIGKSMGIFAAIGLAIGAIGTAIASIASSLLQLLWWQVPFVFLGIFLLISGPSVVLAWLKLRQRSLGPLLEASGWAINGKMKINVFLGSLLTSKAKLPKNATRNLVDPTNKRRRKITIVFLLAMIIGASTAGYFWYNHHKVTNQQIAAEAVKDKTDK